MVVTGAIDKKAVVHVTLEPGIYYERISYNLSNPLILESSAGTSAEKCVIQAENCEAFNKGIENRTVFVLGPNCTDVTLRNISVVNTHLKSGPGEYNLADAAEAIFWNNTNGSLIAHSCRFEGRQNTMTLKGFAWFESCYISGDTDFISGDCDTILFESCHVHVREDNRGDKNGWVVLTQTLANRPGYIFCGCNFTADKRKKGNVWLFKTTGKGKADSPRNWDSAALINCVVQENFHPELEWDDDHNLEVFPRANAKCGWREYNTKVMDKNGNLSDADTIQRNVKSYVLTEDDYFESYSSRYLILKDTPIAEKLDR